MARIVLTALVADIRGKIAGTVIQQGQYGLIIKSNKWRCNSQYKKIGDWKIKTGNVFHLWKRLAPDQKAAWKAEANANPIIRPDGTTYKLSGYMQFTKTNLPLAFADQPLEPTPGVIPPADYVQNLTINSVWNSPADFQVQTLFDKLNPAQDLLVKVFASDQLPAGSPRPTAYNYYLNTYNPVTSPLSIGSDLLDNINEWQIDKTIWFKFDFQLSDETGDIQTLYGSATSTHDPLVPPYAGVSADITNYASPADFGLSASCYIYDTTFKYRTSYYLSPPTDPAGPFPDIDAVFMATFNTATNPHDFTTEWMNRFGGWPENTVIYGYALTVPINVGGGVQRTELLFTQQ